MNTLVPSKVFLTKGVGQHRYRLKSFEEALRMAGVAQQNLVQVSSILPPRLQDYQPRRGSDEADTRRDMLLCACPL